MFSGLKRLFMDPHQKVLTRPEDFHHAFDPDEIRAEIERGATGHCHEGRDAMRGAIRDLGDEPLTLANAVRNKYASDRTFRYGNYPDCVREAIVLGRLGTFYLVTHLTRKANELAKVEAGAEETLGKAFG